MTAPNRFLVVVIVLLLPVLTATGQQTLFTIEDASGTVVLRVLDNGTVETDGLDLQGGPGSLTCNGCIGPGRLADEAVEPGNIAADAVTGPTIHPDAIQGGGDVTVTRDGSDNIVISATGDGGLTLPFAGSASVHGGAAFDVTNTSVAGGSTAISVSSGRNGFAVDLAEVFGFWVKSASTGLQVSSASTGVNVTASSADGLRVESAGTPSTTSSKNSSNGVEVQGAEGNGLFVGRADQSGVLVNSAGGNGMGVAQADLNGVQVLRAGSPSTLNGNNTNDGFDVQGAEGNGLHVGRADLNGMRVQSAGSDGVQVESADDDGVQVGLVGSPSTAITGSFLAHNGFQVAGAESNGLYVGRADNDGVFVESAGSDGVQVESAGSPSTTFFSNESNGVEVAGAEGNGLYVGRADNNGVFVKRAGSPSTTFFSNASDGFEVQGAEGHGLFVGQADLDGVHVHDAGGHAGTLTNNSTDASLYIRQNGSGDLIQASSAGTGGALRFQVTNTGDVFADGSFNGGGADLAEAFAVEGPTTAYGPGDVLVISDRTDRTVERSDASYSSRVAGVYATKPGVLLSEAGSDLTGNVPMGVVGVIPTKVSAENGPIRRGDLLVTATTPGHAMRADPDALGFGMVLGKALAPFEGPGTGVIAVLVNVK